MAVAAAAAIAIALGTVVVARRSTSADFDARLQATALAPAPRIGRHHTQRRRFPHRARRGLPALPAGQYYQAWLKNPAGTLVPIGTFSSSDGRVTLWSGVSPREFPAMSVTIESTDNDQTSSGRRVLAGEVHAS